MNNTVVKCKRSLMLRFFISTLELRFRKMNMGNGFGIFTNRGSNLDSSDSDSSLSLCESEEETTNCKDSNSHILSQREYSFDNARFHSDIEVLTFEKVELVVEPMLSINEVISLIFLLFDSRCALQDILIVIAAGPQFFERGKISEWARSQAKNWQTTLLEALAIIQNYEILKKLGCNKEEIKKRFLPSYNTTLNISRVKKMLYRIIECLTPREAKILGNLFEFHDKYQPRFDPDYKYMEFHILFWVDLGYISIDGNKLNLDKLILHLSLFDNMPSIKNIVGELKRLLEDTSELNSLVEDTNTTYPILDPNEVGLLIIMNMDKFYCEPNPKFEHLLPAENLEPRDGSEVDVENLKKTFTNINFKVVEGHNVPDYEFEQMLCAFITEHFMKTHSMLVLCVLSHGREGVVYAANSIPLEIQYIQNRLSENPQIHGLLADKPKVIIIQACQGLKRLIVEPQKAIGCTASKKTDQILYFDGSHSTYDGPERFSPKYSDVAICIAIIPGYAAVRCPKKGTIYINKMCDCISRYYKKKHFLDIVTLVQKELNSKLLHIRHQVNGDCNEHLNCQRIYMTPIKYDTFRKNLFLVPVIEK